MKWYFKLVLLSALFCSCESQNTLTVEDYLVAKSRNSYLIIDIGSLDLYIQEEAPGADDPDVHLVYPLINAQSKNTLTSIKGITFDSACSFETWLWDGEKTDISQSKVSYQRALVKKEGKWYIAQCQGTFEVSAYTFRDEMLQWGATSVVKLEYSGAYMGWYRYGGANIEKWQDLAQNPKPTAFLVVK